MLTVIISIVAIIVFGGFSITQAGDLLQMHMDVDNTKKRSEFSFNAGVNIPSAFKDGGGGKLVDLSAGLKKKGGCGSFDIGATIKGLFNKEVLDQYIAGLTGAIVTGAPLLLTCYASQTLCDLYKHFRNMANAGIALRNAQCQQIEQLAMSTGTQLRKTAEERCVAEEQYAGNTDQYAVTKKCGSATDLKIDIPGLDKLADGYNLVDSLATKFTDDPAMQKFIKGILGDIEIKAGVGIARKYPRYAEESILSELTHKYQNAIKDVGESVAKGGTPPSAETLKTVSTPGVPITPQILTKLRFVDPVTRDNFYSQYATVAAMTAMLYRIEDLVDQLEGEKAAIQDEVRKKEMETIIKKTERKYDLMMKRLQLQRDYLNPIMVAILSHQPPIRTASSNEKDITAVVPRSMANR